MTKSCPKIVVARPPPGPPLDDDGLLGSKVEMSSLGTIPRFFGLGLDLDPSMSSIVLALGGRPFAIADADVCCDIDRGTLDLSYHDRIVELDVLRWPRLDASVSLAGALDPFLLEFGRMFAVPVFVSAGSVSDSSSQL